MKTFYSRIEVKKRKGKTYYQPQLKRKGFWFILNQWGGLSMLIVKQNSYDLKIWTLKKEEAEEELKRFEYLHKVTLIPIE